MRKGTYRAVEIKTVNVARVAEAVRGKRVVFAVDVGKEEPFARVVTDKKESVVTVKWKQPSQTREVVEWLGQLEAGKVEVVMEPTGTYGDALRAQAWAAGYEVYRVNPKRVHDAAESYDGVPSHHDAKSAAIVADLHLEGASELWPMRPEQERELGAAVKMLELYEEPLSRLRNQLEALLARHWPELEALLELDSAALLALLSEYGSARQVAEHALEARGLLRRVGGHLLSEEKIEAVLASARTSTGLDAVQGESELLRTMGSEMQRLRALARQAERKIEHLAREDDVLRAMSTAVGKASAVVLSVEAGAPKNYPSVRQYQKALGLNLKEKSSGKDKGGKHITKRGSGTARRVLYLAAMRLVKDNPVVRAWYQEKVKRDAGAKGVKVKALVAIMRKLAAALWHLGVHGGVFDATRLYDLRRLGLEPAARAAGAAGS